MPIVPRAPSLALALTLGLAGCTGDDGGGDEPPIVFGDSGPEADMTPEPDVGPDLDAAPDQGPPPDMMLPELPVDPVCNAGTAYAAGTAMFVERTAEWQLEAIGAEATRLSVGDIDGDGWADVMARRGGRRSDILVEGEERREHHWLLHNEGDRFTDATETSGVLAVRGTYPLPVGRPIDVAAFADVDGDGDLDLYCGIDTRDDVVIEREGEEPFEVAERSELLLNDGTGVFTLAPIDHPLRRVGVDDVPSGAAFVDFDRDGNIDLWMSQGGLGASMQDILWRGDGAGGFTDVTRLAGLRTVEWAEIADINEGLGHTTAWSAAACDLNNDGITELLAASYGRAPNHLWQGTEDRGTISFTNRSVASGYAYDDDMTWQDDQFARCYCASNRGAEGCSDVPQPNVGCGQDNWNHNFGREPFRLGGNSGATVCADLNNDGWMDLYTTEIKHWWAGRGADGGEPLVNSGEADIRFDRPGTEATGTQIEHPPFNWDEGHITAGYLDVDNDGRQDIYVGATDYAGNRGRLYRNVSEWGGAVRFEEVPTDDFFEHNRSHGMAVADFDRDGDLDLIVGHSRARCDANAPNNCYPTMQARFFENVLGQDGNWLQLDLRGGEGTNALAMGARVEVRTAAGLQAQEVGGGYGHFGAQRDRILHFGLGEDCEAVVTIRWPDASLTTQTLRLGSGYRYLVRQGQPAEVAAR